MTGPEHYRLAEQYLARAEHFTYGDGADPVTGAACATQAQAHATLALAAATALGTSDMPADGPTAAAWRRIITQPNPTEGS